jgi:hypothetical protein
MSPFPLLLHDPLTSPPEPPPDDKTCPVIILVRGPELRLLSWRCLTRAEAATVIPINQSPTYKLTINLMIQTLP